MSGALPAGVSVESVWLVLRKDWDNLAQANPERLDVKYVIDKASKGWNGEGIPLAIESQVLILHCYTS